MESWFEGIVIAIVCVFMLFCVVFLAVMIISAIFPNTDEMKGCVLYSKTLLGDKEELVGKVMMNHHYYNSTYICEGQLRSRIERGD